jgi:hypothetical protein
MDACHKSKVNNEKGKTINSLRQYIKNVNIYSVNV